MIRILLTFLYLLFTIYHLPSFISCGRKGAPLPPEMVFPEAVEDLKADLSEEGVWLVWSFPRRNTNGWALKDLAGFIIYRGSGDAEFEPLVDLKLEKGERGKRMGRYLDPNPSRDKRLYYKIISYNTDGYRSPESNVVEIVIGK